MNTLRREAATYFIRDKGRHVFVRVYGDTVDDLDNATRALVLKLIESSRRGPLGETQWNIYAAQPKDIQRRVRENVKVRELTNWRTGESRPA